MISFDDVAIDSECTPTGEIVSCVHIIMIHINVYYVTIVNL